MKKDGKTVIRYRPTSLYLEDYLPKQKKNKNKKRGKRK